MRNLLVLAAVAWLALRRRPAAPPPYREDDDGVQPPDPRPVYLVTLSRGDPRIGTFSRN